MRYSNQDLYTVLTCDAEFTNLFELLRNYKEQVTHYHGGGILTLNGSSIFDDDNYLISMGTKLVNDKPVYFLNVDQVTVELPFREYVYISNYMILRSELNQYINDEKENKEKGFFARLFGG